MTPGKIVIKEKAYFEPDGLEKPKYPPFPYDRHLSDVKIAYGLYELAMRKYEASKELIGVNNVDEAEVQTVNMHVRTRFLFKGIILKNNQPCEAEITGKTALITEL